ncbi:MAG: hypothetical protein GEV11_20215 [Streptosporangiales bacterium]|nr:hypothetical protein [Streptosporangiales bacterium]
MRDLIRPLLWAVLIWFVGHVLWVFVDPSWTQLEDVETFGGRVLHSDLPPFLICFLAAFVAARLHGAPERFDKVRHTIVALLVPGLSVLGGIVLSVVQGADPQWAMMGLAAQAAGGLGGWLLAEMLPRRDKTPPPLEQYY